LKTAWRWLAGIAVGVVVLALAVALAAALWFDGDAIKGEIEARVERKTGLRLSIRGDLSLSVFPSPGIRVGHAAVANPPGFGSGTMAEFDALSLRLRLKPLLGGTVALDAVVVEGLKLHLARDASGRRNYEALLAPAGTGKPPPLLPAVGGVTLVNGTIRYDDQMSGETLGISDLEFHSGPLSPRRAVPVTAKFRLRHPDRGLEGDASIAAELSMDASLKSFALEPIALTAAIRGGKIPGDGWRLQSEGGLRYDAETRKLSLVNLDLAATGAGLMDTPARLRIARAEADLGAGTARLDHFTLSALELELDGDLAVEAPGAAPRMAGSIRLAPFDPRRLLARLGRPPANEDRDGWPKAVALKGGVSGDNHRVALDPLELTLDGIRVLGRMDLGFGPPWPLTLALGVHGLSAAEAVALTLSGSGRAGEEPSSYEFSDLQLRLGTLTARGEVQLRAAGDGPNVTASVEVPAFDARALLASLGLPLPETRDPETLTRAAARAVVTGGPADLLVDPLELALDDTRLAGSVSVSDAFGDSPAVGFALGADALDTRRYLPFTLPETEQGAGVPASVALLQGLRLNGRLRLGTLVVGEVTLNDVELTARSRNGRLELRSGSLPGPAIAGPVAAPQSLAPAP
jgi:hypothetical protein